MKINGVEVVGKEFAYDGCHKIYVVEDENDKKEALESEYKIVSVEKLESTYNDSCDLRLIRNWKLTKLYAMQGQNAKFDSN